MPKMSNEKVFDLNLYLAEINQYPLLSHDQEIALADRIQQGDYEAREALINSNLRLVVNIARQYYVGGRRSLADLINDGNLGLIQAVGRFQPKNFNTKFSTYAAWWIKQNIRNSIRNGNWPMRIPAYMHTLLSALRKEGITEPEQLENEKGLEILKRIRKPKVVRQKHVDQVIRAMKATILGAVDQGGDHKADFVLDQPCSFPEAENIYIEQENLRRLSYGLNQVLDDRERAVLKGRYGIGCEEMTLREIGDMLGITRERVRQIEYQAMAKLQDICHADRQGK